MRIYIETYGCQMNEHDSKMIAAMLEEAGHVTTSGLESADVVIVNTCSVRERAEKRVLGRLRQIGGLVREGTLLGVVGCVAQRMGSDLTRAVPSVNFVVGTDQYDRLLPIIASARENSRTIATDLNDGQSYDERPGLRNASLLEFVSVMRGCDNYCSYCVVPYVRGRERSRRLAGVVAEVGRLVEGGTREVTLIGQNVNSYSDGSAGFPDLLRTVAETPGLLRVRFATSHPKDLSDDLIAAIAGVAEACEHIHLPVQSGSDEILNAMNRSYSRARYLELVARIRERIPGTSLTTDIIVGFPGETDDMFADTVSLMEEVRFDSAFMFRYSVREGTRAADLDDDVPESVKIERLERIIDLQKNITEDTNRRLIGSVCEVLVEGPSERNPELLFGRTRTAKAIVFPGSSELVGRVVSVPVRSTSAWTLHGDAAVVS